MVVAMLSAEQVDLSPLVKVLTTFWWLWLLIAAIGTGKLAWRLYEIRRLARSGIADVDRMDGATFERFLVTLFRRLGYDVEHTGRRGDYGADLVVTKEGRRLAVQAKRWSKSIGVKAVQEAVAAKGLYKCEAALVVANRAFTRQAQTLARANDVELWDRDVLIENMLAVCEDGGSADSFATAAAASSKIEAAPRAAMPAATESLPSGDEDDHCVVCGVEVSAKVRDYCISHSRRFGGRIYCFQHQRGVHAAALR